MKKTSCFNVLDVIAKNNNYIDKVEMLRDYDFIPTVLTPKHKKCEIVALLYKHIKRHNKKG